MKYFIKRFEFQFREAIHCHMVINIEGGPTCKEMDLARKRQTIKQNTETNDNFDAQINQNTENVNVIMKWIKKMI